MITTGEPAYNSLRNSPRVEADMLERHRFVLAAMIGIDSCLRRQSLAKIGHGLDVLTGPATFAHEWCREQKDAARCQIGRLFDESVDQDRPADRVAHQNASIIKPAELFLESYLPARILGVGFVRHLRVADFIVRPELSPEVFDELVVPIVMRAFCATALNEQHLMWHFESASGPAPDRPLRVAGPMSRGGRSWRRASASMRHLSFSICVQTSIPNYRSDTLRESPHRNDVP